VEFERERVPRDFWLPCELEVESGSVGLGHRVNEICSKEGPSKLSFSESENKRAKEEESKSKLLREVGWGGSGMDRRAELPLIGEGSGSELSTS
jgi:hypothetical protein